MWSDAEKVCEEKISSSCTPNCKGNLVSIHTDFQDQAIFDAFKNDEGTGKPAWIGLRQYCAFCPLEWADHSPFDFRNWQQGEPNNEDGDEDCVETNFFSEGWNDNTCAAKRQFVCQIYTSATNQHPKPDMDKTWPAIGGCKDGWWKYGKACFKIIGGRGNTDAQKEEPAMNWDDSKTQCSNEWAGASLAQFPNIYYQYFANSLVKLAGRDVYIGALTSTTDITFHWDDGSRLTYSYWADGEPNNYGGVEDVALMAWLNEPHYHTRGPGEWNDFPRSYERAAMCYHKLDSSMSENTGRCPEGWKQQPGISNFCYKLVTDGDGFDNAGRKCADLKGETGHPTALASVMDVYEDAFLASMPYSAETNFDPTFDGKRAGIWIGLKGIKDDSNTVKWKWDDGFPFAYTRWGTNEPNLQAIPAGGEGCVYLGTDRSWYVDKCNLVNPFICKSNMDDTSGQVTDDRGELMDCLPGWEPTGSEDKANGHHCMKFYDTAASWFQANYMCEAVGAQLVSIHSESFNLRVKSYVTSQGTNAKYWVGMKRNEVGGLEWTDGSPASYFNWAPGEPSEEWGGEKEDCVNIFNNGAWNDAPCGYAAPFVCKASRPTSNCFDIPEVEKEQCGYPGITAYECEHVFKCCYNTLTVYGKSCYHPRGRKNSEMTPGKAAGIASAVWLVLIFAIAGYFFFFRGTGGDGFANPNM